MRLPVRGEVAPAVAQAAAAKQQHGQLAAACRLSGCCCIFPLTATCAKPTEHAHDLCQLFSPFSHKVSGTLH